MEEALQGQGLAEAGLVGHFRREGSGARDALGEVSFVNSVKADQVGTVPAFMGKCVPRNRQLRERRVRFKSHSTTYPPGDFGQIQSVGPAISS